MPPPAFAQDAGISSELERTASTSPQEKLAYAENANIEMNQAVKAITKMLDAVRRESNMEAINCLSSRLTSVRALVQVSEAAEESMKVALSSQQVEKADHEFRKIAVALHKTRQLLAEAERCTNEGDPDAVVDPTIVLNEPDDTSDDTDPVLDNPFDLDRDPPTFSPFF